MGRRATAAAAAAGVLCTNALPHLATAAAGRRMLTPLAGRDSPPWANAVWGAANLAGGLLLARAATGGGREATIPLEPFALGAAACCLWGVVGERMFGFNEPASGTDAGSASAR